jgi:hypothetical protein
MNTIRSSKFLLFIYLAVIIGVTQLTACANKEVIREEVEVINYVVVDIPNSYLQKCPITPPFTSTTYIALDREKKEKILFDLTASLYTDLKNCNDQIESLNKLYLEKKKLYEQRR